MAILYHGTSVENALDIVEIGAILSPVSKIVNDFNMGSEINPECWKGIDTAKKVETIIKIMHGDAHLERRGRRVSAAINDYKPCEAYANKRSTPKGGLILGVKMNIKEVRDILYGFYEDRGIEYLKSAKLKGSTIFVPDQISLDNLVEVRVDGCTIGDLDEVKMTFAKYNPKIVVSHNFSRD